MISNPRILVVPFISAVCLVLGAGQLVASERAAGGAADRLAGAWRAELSDTQALVLHFQGATVEMQSEAEGKTSPIWKGKFVIPEEQSDRHMDWTELQAGGRALPDNQCLYRLSGETLLIIGGGPKNRPTRFYTGPGPEPRTLIFTRIKPAIK